MNKFQLPDLTNLLVEPICIADGDGGGAGPEIALENYFKSKGIPFTECYNLYKEPKDLSVFKTICFFTTNSYPEKVAKILNFDYSGVKCVVVMSEWAYDIAAPLCKKLGVPILMFNQVLEDKLVDAQLYNGY